MQIQFLYFPANSQSSGECITKTINGKDWSPTFCEIMKCSKIQTALVKVTTGPYTGTLVYLVTGGGDFTYNKGAQQTLYVSCAGDIIVTLARPCGENRYLNNFSSICPTFAERLFRSNSWLDAVDLWYASGTLKQAKRIESKDPTMRRYQTSETSREFWVTLLDAKRKDRSVDRCGATVWCGTCFALYRRLYSCVHCKAVSYCSNKCKDLDYEKHLKECTM